MNDDTGTSLTDEQRIGAESLLAHLVRVMDGLDQRDLPAYAEVCQCGAEMTIAKEVPPAERRRMVANFLGRHNHRPAAAAREEAEA